MKENPFEHPADNSKDPNTDEDAGGRSMPRREFLGKIGKAILAASVIQSGLAGEVEGQQGNPSFRGSPASVRRMYNQALAHDFDFMENPEMLARYVRDGYFVRVPVGENTDYSFHQVSFPYVRPATKLWLERFSGQYRRACGEKLIVTSLTRPRSHQPRNASQRYSVHPAGMSVDLRIPTSSRYRQYLERNLLDMERRGIIEFTKEQRPPHYHIAVFSNQYVAYVEETTGRPIGIARVEGPQMHIVRSGENLTVIARKYGVSISQLRTANNLRGDKIVPGQRLRIPRK